MTSPLRDLIDDAEPDEQPASDRRNPLRIGVVAGALALLVTTGAVVVAIAERSSAPVPTAAATPSVPSVPSATVTPSAAPAPPLLTAAATPAATSTCADKFGVCMSDAQYASTRTELTALAALAALAARLPAHLSLTAPATWAQYASATPTYAEDIVSCPHIADRLGNALGGRWTWFLTSGGGVHQPHGRPADGLLALIDAASRSYS